MKLHGYCLRCHRFKRVNVSVPATNGVQYGVCDDCAERTTPTTKGA